MVTVVCQTIETCDALVVEVSSTEVNLACRANSLANLHRTVIFQPTAEIYLSGPVHPETNIHIHDKVQLDKDVDEEVIMCRDVANYQDLYELPTRTFSDRIIKDIYRTAGKCAEKVVETINRPFTIISNRMNAYDQEVTRISSQVSIMERNLKSHSEVQQFLIRRCMRVNQFQVTVSYVVR